MGSPPTFICWDRWSWYSKVLWTEVWDPLGGKIRRQLWWFGPVETTAECLPGSWTLGKRLIPCDMLASSLSLPLQTFGTGTPKCWRSALVGPLRWYFSKSRWNIHWLTANVHSSRRDSMWDPTSTSKPNATSLKKVSVQPATALTRPISRGERFQHKLKTDAWIPNANHGSETKLAVKLTQLWNIDTALHLKRSDAVKLTTLEITFFDEIVSQLNAVKLERCHHAVQQTNWLW